MAARRDRGRPGVMGVLEVALSAVALGLLVPAGMLLLECAASLVPARRARVVEGVRPSAVVIVPAHDEAAGISACLAALSRQLAPADRVVVVADNCADDTAARARAHGATVLERHDAQRPGKGYALLHALDAIAAAPPDVVIVLDADSVLGPGLIGTLTRAAARTQRPVQGAYLPGLPPQPGVLDRLSAFAFVTKNVTRPAGLARLGLPCLLTGTGMAFPWTVIRAAPIAGDRTAEDMRLAVDMSIEGFSPQFCPEARLTGPLEQWREGPTLQRTRWEHGHLDTLVASVARLFAAAIGRRRPELIGLALELAVPPLSLWVLLWAAAATLAAGAILAGGSTLPGGLLLTGGACVALAVVAAWARDGRSFVPPRTLFATGWYVLRKIPVYATFPYRRRSRWGSRDSSVPDLEPTAVSRPRPNGERR